jgi:hypothetical protein
VKPFSEAVKCAKCHHTAATIRHRDPVQLVDGHRRWADREQLIGIEHMERTCKRCGHRWPELPLDAKTRKGKA